MHARVVQEGQASTSSAADRPASAKKAVEGWIPEQAEGQMHIGGQAPVAGSGLPDFSLNAWQSALKLPVTMEVIGEVTNSSPTST